MIKLNHAMIDIETMATVPEQAIVSIGAVIFDPVSGFVQETHPFYTELDWGWQDRFIDPKTKKWWSEQSKEAQSSLNGKVDLDTALAKLDQWLPRDVKVWGNGPTFDISTLEHAYRTYNMVIPWKFWNIRDCRTVLDLYEARRGGLARGMGANEHNALADAIYQAKQICKMYRSLTKII